MKAIGSYVPSWQDLSIIGNSLPAKISIAAPVLGHLLILNRHVFDALRSGVPSFAPLLPAEHDVSRLASIYFLYMGIFIFGLGSILFQIFCARIIKENNTEDQFVRSNLQHVTKGEILLYIQSIEDAKHISDSQKDLEGVASAKIKFEEASSEITIDDRSAIQICKMYYQMLSTRNLSARAVTFVLMSSGLMLMSVPSFTTFYRVVLTLF